MWSPFDRWSRSHKPTPSELLVARFLLGGSDPRLSFLYRQLEAAPGVRRTIQEHNSYELNLQEVVGGDLSIPIRRTISAPLEVTVEQSGQRLEFQVVIGTRGWFQSLVGRTLDGSSWPKGWAVAADRLAESAVREYLRLPDDEEHRQRIRNFGRWLGGETGANLESAGLLVYGPAPGEELEAWETRESQPLPVGYRSFLEIADGVDVGQLFFLGVQDIRTLDGPILGPEPLLVIADLAEDGVLALRFSTADPAVYYYGPEASGRLRVAENVRVMLRESIARPDNPRWFL